MGLFARFRLPCGRSFLEEESSKVAQENEKDAKEDGESAIDRAKRALFRALTTEAVVCSF
jgi:hypothetical protein